MRLAFFCLLTSLTFAGVMDRACSAQTTTTASAATLTGVVTDSQGAALPNAAVVLEGAGITRRITSDANGHFLFGNLVPGTYSLDVDAPDSASRGRGVMPGQSTNLSIQLQLGDLNQIMGPEFRSEALPLTTALSKHLRNESGVVNPDLKLHYQRPRPFAHDDAIHPVCAQTLDASYPSGHAMVGIPGSVGPCVDGSGKMAAIIKRADQYAYNRVVCGVHFPSDVEASGNIAYVLFGSLAATPRFQSELAAARNELRHQFVVQLAPTP